MQLGSGGAQAQVLAGAGNVVDGGKFGHRAARSEKETPSAHARAREPCSVATRQRPPRGHPGLLRQRLTAQTRLAYRACMEPADPLAQLQDFAARVEALLERNQRLAEENRSLRHQQEQLVAERSTLLAKNEQARSRVEAMISRLKSLEQHT
jgi:cell division protein ZapB